MASLEDSRQVLLGRITGAYGIKGWVKVHSFTNPIENIVEYLPWELTLGREVREMDVAEGRLHGKGLVVRLDDVNDRNAAEALRGAEIYVARDQLPELDEGEYYWEDLAGLTVINQVNEELGLIDQMLDTGANDVMVVKGAKGRQLIPYISGDVVKQVDLDAGVVKVDWLEPE